MIPKLTEMALFLDVDGTLLGFQEQPDDVNSSASLTDLLRRLCNQLEGALALVSGRPLDELDRIFAPEVFTAAGGHGSQLRLLGGDISSNDQHYPDASFERLDSAIKCYPGAFVERKSHGAALHYRACPENADKVHAIAADEQTRLGDEFTLLAGKMVYEILPATINKGRAVERLMNNAPFAGRRPVFLGDDVTDEFGFAAVNAQGGLSIRVGPKNDQTRAMECLDSVTAVHEWLASLLETRP
ncbi:MAG: trehalose-phosphatase [Lysobacterales bacterium]